MHFAREKKDTPLGFKRTIACSVFVALFIFFVEAEASSFSVSPTNTSHTMGENFTMTVFVDADTSINAVTGVIRFPTSKLKVLGVDKNKKSIVNLWTLEPSFSNRGDSGNVTFEGVILNPGFVGQGGHILTITFEALAPGSAEVTFSRAAILANDGLGTSLPVSALASTYTLTSPKPARAAASESELVPAGESSAPSQIVVIREIEPKNTEDFFWDALPTWIRVLVMVSIGVTTVIFGFIAASLGILILIWIWSNVWHHRMQFMAFMELCAVLAKTSVRRALVFSEFAGAEIWGDAKYAFNQFKNEIELARSNPPSFKQLLADYFALMGRIVRRFVTTNTAEPPRGTYP